MSIILSKLKVKRPIEVEGFTESSKWDSVELNRKRESRESAFKKTCQRGLSYNRKVDSKLSSDVPVFFYVIGKERILVYSSFKCPMPVMRSCIGNELMRKEYSVDKMDTHLRIIEDEFDKKYESIIRELYSDEERDRELKELVKKLGHEKDSMYAYRYSVSEHEDVSFRNRVGMIVGNYFPMKRQIAEIMISFDTVLSI